jgi:hypothetical protein
MHLQLPSSHGRRRRQRPANALAEFHEEAKPEFTAARTGDPPPPSIRNLSIERTSATSSPKSASTRSTAASTTTSGRKKNSHKPTEVARSKRKLTCTLMDIQPRRRTPLPQVDTKEQRTLSTPSQCRVKTFPSPANSAMRNARRTRSKSFVRAEDNPEPPPSPDGALEDDTGEEKLEELPLQLYKDLLPRRQAPLHPPSLQGTPEGRGPADRRRKGEITFKIAQEHCSLGKDEEIRIEWSYGQFSSTSGWFMFFLIYNKISNLYEHLHQNW